MAKRPQVDATAVLAKGALLIGDVTVEAGCYIGPNAVLRGDIEPILIKRGSNIQDNCVVHTDAGHPCTIGPDASVGHGAVVHGARVGKNALIGMNAVVLSGAQVGDGAIVGALALVPEGGRVPETSVAVGIPCRILKEGDASVRATAKANAERYHGYRDAHRRGDFAVREG